jgi:hypothetical protein
MSLTRLDHIDLARSLAGRIAVYRPHCGDRIGARLTAGERAGCRGSGAGSGAPASPAAVASPARWAVILVVVLGSANSHPTPGVHGKGLAVTLALCVFALALLIAIRDGFPERSLGLQAAVIAVMGAAGVADRRASAQRSHRLGGWCGGVLRDRAAPAQDRRRAGWCRDRRARRRHGDRRELVVGHRGRGVDDGAAGRVAPHQLRHAHAVEMAHEGVPLVVIQRQLAHANLGITSVYLQGIDSSEIVSTVHGRPSPTISATVGLQMRR